DVTKAFISFKDFSKRLIRISNLSSREAAICWRSKELEGEEDGRGAFVLTLESVTRLREYRTLDLLSIIAEPSQDPIQRNIKWYQSLVISYQEKNNIQAEQKKKMVKTRSSSENKACCSKVCLSSVEARLVKFKNQEIKFCEKIRGLEVQLEFKTNRIERLTKELEELKKEKEGLESKLTVLFPPPAQVYSPPKKDMSWTGLPEFADDTITDYTRPSPSVESNLDDL
nr:hypothetical protein [Tanacetum cinerariifolium]